MVVGVVMGFVGRCCVAGLVVVPVFWVCGLFGDAFGGLVDFGCCIGCCGWLLVMCLCWLLQWVGLLFGSLVWVIAGLLVGWAVVLCSVPLMY